VAAVRGLIRLGSQPLLRCSPILMQIQLRSEGPGGPGSSLVNLADVARTWPF